MYVNFSDLGDVRERWSVIRLLGQSEDSLVKIEMTKWFTLQYENSL